MRLNSKPALSVVSSASLPNATRMSPLWTTSLNGMSICPCAIRLRKKWSMTTYASYARCRVRLRVFPVLLARPTHTPSTDEAALYNAATYVHCKAGCSWSVATVHDLPHSRPPLASLSCIYVRCRSPSWGIRQHRIRLHPFWLVTLTCRITVSDCS